MITVLVCGWLFLVMPPAGSWAASAPDIPKTMRAGEESVTAIDGLGPLYRIHANSHFRTTVTNWGYFGNRNGDLIDSIRAGAADPPGAPGFESPPFSRINYLYEAGLWVGGIVGPDTMVSVGAMAWPPTFELHPKVDSPPVFSDTLGDEEFTSVFSDTLSDPSYVREDAIDGPHRPLPIRIRQTTRLTGDPAFDKGLIIEVTITNTGTQTIRDLWLGWYIDCDIRHPDNPQSWRGDLSGFHSAAITLNGNSYTIRTAWTADNNGDPDDTNGFSSSSPLGVFGSAFLGSSVPLPEESFNWWNVGFTRAYDWGPSRNPDDTNAAGGYGRTLGDAVKYRRMSNREIDYDQVYAAIDRTADGWIPPTDPEIAENFANGYDARFLHTRGMVDLAPGDSLVAAWAWVVADGFHTDPAHFADVFSAQAPGAYLAGLNFAPLDTALARMALLRETNFTAAAIGPPRGFAVTGWDDSTATVHWTPRGTQRLAGYEVYRSLDSISFPGPPAATLNGGDSVLTETGLERERVYYYTIRTVDTQGRAGPPSTVVDVLPDRPLTPVPVGVDRGDNQLRLKWAPPAEPDVVAHTVYRRVPDGVWDNLGVTYFPGSFLDMTAVNAVVYEYRLAAISQLGNESYPTSAITGVAFAFHGPPLVIDHTLSGSTSLTDKDSVAAVWQRLTGPIGARYTDADPATRPPFTLDLYNQHPATLVVSDGREGLRPETGDQLEIYEYAGGISILSGRDLFNKDVLAEGTVTFGPGDHAYDHYGVTSVYFPRVLLSHPTRPNAEFIGARAVPPGYPDLAAEPARSDWGLNPALPSAGGAVPFVGFLTIDTARAEIIYTYISRDSMKSSSHGEAVGIVSRVPGVRAAVLTFPLSYMDEGAASLLIQTLLNRLGWVGDLAGDLSGDGMVMADDVALLIDYLFRAGALTNLKNADVNGDCRVNLVDLVILINHVFLGGPSLAPGC